MGSGGYRSGDPMHRWYRAPLYRLYDLASPGHRLEDGGENKALLPATYISQTHSKLVNDGLFRTFV